MPDLQEVIKELTTLRANTITHFTPTANMARLLILLLFLLLRISSLPLLAQNPDGTINNPLPIPEESGTFEYPAMQTVLWYAYTAQESGYAQLTFFSLGGFDAYTGTPDALQLVTSDEFNYPSGPDQITFPVQAGVRYLIKISRANALTYPASVRWEFSRGGVITIEGHGYLGGLSYPEVEGIAELTFLRHGPAETTATLRYSLQHGDTTAADVLFEPTGTVVFGPNEKRKSIPILIREDTSLEGPESFSVYLEHADGAILTAYNSTTAVIADAQDDPPNDLLENAQVLTGIFGNVAGTLKGADPDFHWNDVFYAWTAPVSGEILMSFSPGTEFFGVYEGTLTEDGNLFTTTDPPYDIRNGRFTAVAGRTYTFVMGNPSWASLQNFAFAWDMDQDGDSLYDSAEAAAGTSPTDVDSDDDGVTDDAELRLHEDIDGDGLVNGLDPDSDGDGLFDGTEMGVTVPSSGTDLSAARFIADADAGATTTDMLLADTDLGGAEDGYEDKNRNGTVDAGEADPNDWRDDPVGTIRFQVVEASADEGNTASVVVERVGNFRGIATVSYATTLLSGPGAANAEDFVATTGTVTFAGDVRDAHIIEVPLVEDANFEDAELFGITLSAPVNAVVEPGAGAVVTILNDDNYTGSKESYSGIFSTAEGPAGGFGLNLSPSGTFTGTLLHEHRRYGFRGKVGHDGSASVTIKRRGEEPLLLDLQMTGGSATVEARLRDGLNDLGLELEADRSPFGKALSALPAGVTSQKFTVLLPPTAGVPEQFAGTGYAVGILTSKGALRLTGVLPDGTKFSAGSRLDVTREAVLQQSLYKKAGGLYGTLAFDAASNHAQGELSWSGLANLEDSNSRFIGQIDASAFPYTVPGKGERIVEGLSADPGDFVFNFDEPGDEGTFEALVNLGVDHRITDKNSPSLSLKGTVKRASGAANGKLQLGEKLRFSGVFVQETGAFEGLFMRPGTTGRVRGGSLPEPQ